MNPISTTRRSRTGLVLGAALVVTSVSPALATTPSTPHHGGGIRSGDGNATAARAAGWKWKEELLTEKWATGIGITRPDAHRTWVSGMEIYEDPWTRYEPALWQRDDRTGGGWKKLPTAKVPKGYDRRWNDVDASSAKNAVLVGDLPYEASINGILTQLWDGKSWRNAVAPVPKEAESSGFLSVDTLGPNDAWAAGWAQVPTSRPDNSRHVGTLQHWDGKRWKPAKVPDVGEGKNGGWSLNGVAARSATDVWAVGATFSAEAGKPLLLHYDGKTWTKVALPDLGDVRADGSGIALGPKGQVWAVGSYRGKNDAAWQGLVLRYDGKKWTRVALPKGTESLASVTVSRGTPIVLVDEAEDGVQALRREETRWVSLGLPNPKGDPLSGIDIAAHGQDVDITGARPDGTEYWRAVTLTATAGKSAK